MIQSLHRFLLLLSLFLITAQTVRAQETEADIKVKADKLFESEKYVDATQLYLRLIALNPRSTDYNYRYGTCLLFNSYKKLDAFKYLNFSVSDPNIDVDAFYFLGKAHHLNYQFNEAIKNYELYKQKAGSKTKPSFEIDRQIEMCQNGKRLLITISDLVVLEKKEIEIADFFRLYNLKNIGGDIIVASNFQSKIDKKKNFVPLIHFPANSTSVYYASYGESDTGQKDIYTRKKLPDGSWSLPQLIGGNANTKFDEDFPYMHPNGQFLYYCSKGHNSMGGYDIFRSKYDPESNSFGVPENMDFAISSPDNDLFYVVDSLDQNAYFASSRQSTNGKMFVYKVRVERFPIQLAVVKGDFSSSIHPENKKITITVTDFATNEKVGTFTSTEKGKYLITFPKGGKYNYEMKVEGSSTVHKYVVSIPFLKEFKPLKQKIQEETLESAEVVRVTDLFNEEVEDPQSVLAEVIKLRSELNVNVQSFNLEELEAAKENERILAELGLGKASAQEIGEKFDALVQQQNEKTTSTENITNGALQKSLDNLNDAETLQNEAKNLVAKSNSAETPKEKYDLLKEAQQKMTSADALKSEVMLLTEFADSTAKELSKEKEQLVAIKNTTEAVKLAAQNNDATKIKEAVSAQSQLIKELSENQSSNSLEPLLAKKTELGKEKTKLQGQKINFEATEKSLGAEIENLNSKLASAKTKDQPAIQSSIDSKMAEKTLVTEEKERIEKKLTQNESASNALNGEIAFLNDVTNVKNTKVVSPAEVKAKLAEVDTKNNRSLDAYIDSQLIALSKDPSVANNTTAQNGNNTDSQNNGNENNGNQNNGNTQNSVATSAALTNLNNVVSEIDADQKLIAESKELSAKQKMVTLNGNDNRVLSEARTTLTSIEAEIKNNPSSADLQADKKKVEAIIAEKETDISNRKKEIAAINQKEAATAPPTPENELIVIFPAYKEEKLAARQPNPENQLIALNEVDEKLVVKINTELEKVTAEIAVDPSASRSVERKKALEELKKRTNDNIANRNAAIAQLGGNPTDTNPTNNGSNTAETFTPTTQEKELALLVPDYEERKSKLPKTTEKEELESLNQLDKEVLSKLNQSLQSINVALAKNPTDAKAKDQQAVLAQLKTKTEASITARDNRLKELQTTPAINSTPEVELATLNPNYENEMRAAVGNDQKETLQNRNAIDEALVAKISDELEKTSAALLENPSDKKVIDRQKSLENLKASTEKKITERTLELEALETIVETTNSATPEKELASIFPDYTQRVNSISASSDSDAKEQQQALEKELLTKVTAELKRVEDALVDEPNDPIFTDRKVALESLKAQVESRIETTVAIQPKDTIVESSEPNNQIAEIRPKYIQNIQKIDQSGLSETEKNASKLKEERALLTDVEETIQKNDARLADNPNQPELIAKNERLKEFQAVQEAKVNEQETDLVAIEKAKIKPESFQTEIFPEYVSPNLEEKSSWNEKKVAELVKQEDQLQQKLVKVLRANEKKLASNFNPELAAQNKVITELMEQSVNRKQAIETTAENVTTDITAAAIIDSELGDESESLMRQKSTSKEEAEEKLTKLNAYLSDLEEKEAQQANDSQVGENEKALTKEQIAVIRKRIGSVSVELDEFKNLATNNGVNQTANPNTENDIALKQLSEKEAKLQNDIASGTANEKKAALKELKQVQIEKKQLTEKNDAAAIAVLKETQKSGIENLKASNTAENLVKGVVQRATEESGKENVTSEEKRLKTIQATNLIQATESYVQLVSDSEKAGVVVGTKDELAAVKRKFAIEVGQLESEIANEQNAERKNALTQQQKELKNAIEKIENLTVQLEEEKTSNLVVSSGLETAVSFEEEMKLASNPEYANLIAKSESLKQSVNQAAGVQSDMDRLRLDIAQESNQVEKDKKIDRLAALAVELKTLKSEVKNQSNLVENALVASSNESGFRNLLARDVIPVQPKTVSNEVLDQVADGFEIRPTATTIAATKPIVVDAKTPSGLVYRVQVGAFAKPIPEDLFKEFTPVTGERLNNGITRYLAGYFGDRNKVVDAQKQIRALGYGDAFVVAYCDGQRISLAEARRLEDLGLCVPKKQDSIVMEVVQNTIAQLPEAERQKLQTVAVRPSDYNKAPGAVAAEAVEEKKGLFFTVQVGVYNRPVPAEQVKNIAPLVTKRLENGQIRYSSGVFKSIAEARPKRKEAITRGITDAFITAYFNGERISLDEAKRMLAENGPSILVSDSLVDDNVNQEQAIVYRKENPLPMKLEPVQLISKEQYTVFPREELNRLNVVGTFVYDENSKRIKSAEYSSLNALPSLQTTYIAFDTLNIAEQNRTRVEPNTKMVVAVWGNEEISGESANWLVRSSLVYKAKRSGENTEIQFVEVPNEQVEALQSELARLGFNEIILLENE